MTDGSIMIDKTIIAENRLAPSGSPKISLPAGTTIIIPIRPYTTEGIPDISPTSPLVSDAIFLFAYFAAKTAHSIPTGTPTRIAPKVP